MSGVRLMVELCAGTAALSLRLHAGRNARPPVSRMGAKTGYADVILRCLGLRPGQGHTDGTRYLWCEPDAGVRLLLHAYTDRALATAAADIIRGWKDEDPRALWERLRAEGPATCPEGLTAREVARWLWVAKRTAYMDCPEARGGTFLKAQPDKGNLRWPATSPAAAVVACPTLPAAIHADARAIDPREVARWLTVQGWAFTREPGRLWEVSQQVDPAKCGIGNVDSKGRRWGVTDQAWIAGRIAAAPTLPATIHPDARAIDPPALPPGTVAYIDGPYENTTKYAHDLPRAEQVDLARRWADAGATVCISEAEPIPELVADGWHKVEITGERKGQRRTFSKQQREWLTMNRAPSWVPSVQGSLFGGAS